MALTTEDLDHVRALWEEWTAGKGFRLSVEVKEGALAAQIVAGTGMSARLAPALYCRVEVWRLPVYVPDEPRCVFSDTIPCDREALRASVSVLARTIAEWDENLAERERDEQP